MAFLPICKQDLIDRDIEKLDFIMISGDAYVDHHSFGHAVVARFLESKGFSVGIIPQPTNDNDYKVLGLPNVAFLVSSGVVDSMVNNYTVAKKKRTTDDYSAGGVAGKRPDRATIVYSKNIRRIFGEDVAIVIGGIEPSLRRFAHYDYWKDAVMPSILADSKADLLIYGMGESPFSEISAMLHKGVPMKKIRNIRGTCYLDTFDNLPKTIKEEIKTEQKNFVVLQSYSVVKENKLEFAKCFGTQNKNTDSINAKGLIQEQQSGVFLVQNPPAMPLSIEEMDEVYALPFERTYHPSYQEAGGVPAINEVKFSITSHRGCFGSCSYCALNYHCGRVIQKRSEQSILQEAETMAKDKDFKGYVHDVGGPTANFRNKACKIQEKAGVCQNKYCIGNSPCKNLVVDHTEYLELLQKVRRIKGVKKVFIRSGIRFDYLMLDKNKQFFHELIKYHISGQLKVAPEHISDKVLCLMNKPSSKVYKEFSLCYKEANEKNGLNQFLVPYFISSHPGCNLSDAVDLAVYLKSINYMPMQVQDFYPTPSTRSTCMFYSGYDPDTLKEVYVPKSYEMKAMQRALLQYRKKENYELVKKALYDCGRTDLIGFGANCLIKPLKNEVKYAKNNEKTSIQTTHSGDKQKKNLFKQRKPSANIKNSRSKSK